MMLMILASLLVAYLTALSIVVLVQNPISSANRSLVASMALISAWMLGVFGLTTKFGESLLYARVVFAFGLWSAVALAFFVAELTGQLRVGIAEKQHERTMLVMTGLVLGLPLVVTPIFIKSIIVEPDVLPVPVYGPGIILYIAALGLVVFSVASNLIYGYKRATADIKPQLKSVAYSIVLALSIATLTNLILPALLDNTQSALLTPVAVVILMTGLSYSIAKHKLLDVRSYVFRSSTYLVMASILGLVYVAPLVLLMAWMFDVAIWPIELFATIVLATVVAANYHRVQLWFRRLTNKIFFRDAYDPSQFINGLNKVLIASTGLPTLLEKSSEYIKKSLKAEICCYLLSEKDGTTRILPDAIRTLDDEGLQLIKSLDAVASVVNITEELTNHDEIKSLLHSNNIALTCRILLSESSPKTETRIGYLLLGPRYSGKRYNQQDVHLIKAAANVLNIALQNALHYEEIQQFNETLKDKVEDATHKLRLTNEKLQRMYDTKDEFISMASHQLRTPLTSVKGYLSMVLEGDVGPITDQQRQLLNQSFQSSQRMANLISDLLNLSRINTGKFVIEYSPVDLRTIIDAEISQLREIAEAKGIKLTYEPPVDFPTLMLDAGKMHQVIMNLVDNAIYYTPSGGSVTVLLKAKPSSIEFMVVDTGIGVPREAQRHLFTKMFRAENARRARPDGTGLGLFMVKKVVVEQKGAVIFETEEGKGSSFGFRFNKKDHLLPASEPSGVNPVIQ